MAQVRIRQALALTVVAMVVGACHNANESGSSTTTTLRPCVEYPSFDWRKADQPGFSPPDGTYLVSIVWTAPNEAQIYLDNSGAGNYWYKVPVTADRREIGKGPRDYAKVAITVRHGQITTIDYERKRWDQPQQNGDLSCATAHPDAATTSTSEP